MKRVTLLLTVLFFLCACAQSQKKKMPVIKADSTYVDIRDGGKLVKRAWRIVPDARPDVYKTFSKRVTFRTNCDSITLDINPKVGTYDFVILLNGKDSAYTQIQYQESYLSKLKKAEKYNLADKRYIPKFEYQSMDNPNLVNIRKTLKLDSIAGGGNEISRILNLMHWVHNVVRHDGSSYNPASKNAIDIINVCRTEKRGVNCRMMATILNECYLSLGIKSRYITCMPKETKFDDCHVINMVYSNDLKKWIWIDPTFDAYVMDEKGTLLGLSEVRERLINGRPLILNPEANWNHKSSQTKEHYLETYMAKNLYRLETPALSQYNTETSENGKELVYIELLPLDGLEQTPQKKEETNIKTGVKYVNFKTNNPGLFWAKPE